MDPLLAGTTELKKVFAETLFESIDRHVESPPDAEVQRYLTTLLLQFLHTDKIFAIRDRMGNRLISVTEMVAEGDVRLNADSFEREREVHKHIGDFLLFWSGVYPEFLRKLKLAVGQDLICDYERQGRESYYLVSTFDQGPFSDEARTFRRLSEGFEDFAFCLSDVRQKLKLAPW